MNDRHAVHRNLHVVPLGATPAAGGEPTTAVLGLANAGRRARRTELVIDRGSFTGHLSLLLPRQVLEGVKLKGFELTKRRGLGDIGEHLDTWNEGIRENLDRRAELRGEDDSQVEQLCALDLNRGLVMGSGGRATLSGLAIPAGEEVWTAITLQAPEDAQPGDSYRFDVIQRAGRQITGGSTYMVGVPRDTG